MSGQRCLKYSVGRPDFQALIEAGRDDSIVFEVSNERNAVAVPFQRADELTIGDTPELYGVVEAGGGQLFAIVGKRRPVDGVVMRQ